MEETVRIYPICSSSRGNCTFIGGKNGGILVDLGCSFTAMKKALEAIGVGVEAIRAVVVTHEHTDHVNGLKTFTGRLNTPVFASPKTLDELVRKNYVCATANLFTTSELEKIDFDAQIKAFRTPHDSVESVGYTIETSEQKIGFCTDLGEITDEVRANILGCRTVFLEANYEPSMLSANPNYPIYLKQRISGSHGHLSNIASGAFSAELIKNGTRQLILGHLSPENNTPQTAFDSVCSRLTCEGAKRDCDYLLEVAPRQNEDGHYIVI